MKRILIALLAVLSVGSMTFAQGEKSLKQASKSLNKFTSDFSNKAALQDAKMKIEEAFQDEKVASSAKSWNTRGDIYFNIADAEMKQKLINPAFETSDETAAIQAVDAYIKALGMAEKKGDVKNALEGLRQAEDILNNIGIDQYQSEKYVNAYHNFDAEIRACKVLRENGMPSRLDEGTLYTEKVFFAGITAYYGKNYEDSVVLLEEAEATGTSDGSLYQLLYDSYKNLGRIEKGLTHLQKGREKFPEDSNLLFTEINLTLEGGKKEEVVRMLNIALEKEPDNISVMITIGQVYDQLHSEAQEKLNREDDQLDSEDAEKSIREDSIREYSEMYFNKSLEHYYMAIEKNPLTLGPKGGCYTTKEGGVKEYLDRSECSSLFDVNYNLGALYYNKAATFTPALNEAANDLSPAGNKKYDEIKADMAGYFDRALPYFLKADQIKPTDRNTIIALKEIYVRKDMFEKSNEYKEKLEALPEN